MIRMTFVVVSVLLGVIPAAGQERGYLAIDEQEGRHAFSFRGGADAENMCGTTGCEVVTSFGSCLGVAYSAGLDVWTWTWTEAGTEADARVGALNECEAAGGPACAVLNVYCVDAPGVEAALGLDQAMRRRIQQGLGSAGFDAGVADGLFGRRTRQAIRGWQASRGAWASGYLTAAQAEALQVGGGPAGQVAAAPAAAVPAATAAQETVFWQSVANSTNPAEFEAYLGQFPNGVFSALARARLAALRTPAGPSAAASGTRVGGAGTLASGGRGPAARRPAAAGAPRGVAAVDVRRQPGEVFRDCAECPEVVVLAGGRVALGRYEVTVGEYRAFAQATGGGAGGGCITSGDGDSWRNPGFPQTDRHPVACVTWDDAQEYVSWLSRTTGATYRLPTEEEWGRAAAGTPERGCGSDRSQRGTCPVGSYGANAAGLSDVVGNLWEWTADCWEGDCRDLVIRGGSWADYFAVSRRPGARHWAGPGDRFDYHGFRVARTFD